jgi:hypothetical protein
MKRAIGKETGIVFYVVAKATTHKEVVGQFPNRPSSDQKRSRARLKFATSGWLYPHCSRPRTSAR